MPLLIFVTALIFVNISIFQSFPLSPLHVTSKQTDKATGEHFNLPGHSVANLKVSIIEQVKFNSDLYRKEREEFYIRKFNTLYEGMNRKV